MNLFQRKIDPRCAYCAHGHALGESQVVCPKKGVMAAASFCHSFQYDPLKRVPPRPAKLAGLALGDEDFTL